MQLIFDPRYRKLVDFLSLDSVDLEEQHVPEKIMFLYDWAEKKTMGGDLQDVLVKLNSLKKDIGTTLRGKELLKDLYKWTRLDADKMQQRDTNKLKRLSIEEEEAQRVEARRNSHKREKIWKETKEELYREAQLAEKSNKARFNINKRIQLLKEQKLKEAEIEIEDVKTKIDEPISVEI